MRRILGTLVMNYEITTGGVLKLSAGKDGIALPLSDFTLNRQGAYFLVLKRNKTWMGMLVLMFDDHETLERAKALIVAPASKRRK